MEKLRIKYSEMYSIVPAEVESQAEECRRALEDADEKVVRMRVRRACVRVYMLLLSGWVNGNKKISFDCHFLIFLLSALPGFMQLMY